MTTNTGLNDILQEKQFRTGPCTFCNFLLFPFGLICLSLTLAETVQVINSFITHNTECMNPLQCLNWPWLLMETGFKVQYWAYSTLHAHFYRHMVSILKSFPKFQVQRWTSEGIITKLSPTRNVFQYFS